MIDLSSQTKTTPPLLTQLWKSVVILFSPSQCHIIEKPWFLSITYGNRNIQLRESEDCVGSVQRDFQHLDQPEFSEPLSGQVTIAPGSPDAFSLGKGTLAVQHWYSFSTSRPSVLEAWRIRLWLLGKIDERKV